MGSPIDTQDWVLGAWMDWKPAKDKVICLCCNGSGTTGGGFKSMEGPQTCSTCYGTGVKTFYPSAPKPEIPQELREHMYKAWKSYWDVGSLFNVEENNA